MSLKFGKTWWGKKWISALEEIDTDTNRLPRGRTYARNEQVKEIKWNGKEILAKVKGSRNSPYQIRISPKLFSLEEKKRIEELFSENPSILGEFSVGKITPEIEKFFEKNKIQIFPNSWEELNSSCSCPDWADPCKHRAAVYYLLANEIDKNPFLLFEWRGVNLQKITGKEKKEKLKKSDLFFIPKEDFKKPKENKNLEIDFHLDKLNTNSILENLDENPVFYSPNFKTILKSKYKEVTTKISETEMKEIIPSFLRASNIFFVFPKNLNYEFRIFVDNEKLVQDILQKKFDLSSELVPKLNSRNEIEFVKMEGLFFSIEEIAKYFYQFPVFLYEHQASPSIRFLNLVLNFITSILNSGSFFPSMKWKSSTEFEINYNALLLNESSIEVLSQIKEFFDSKFGYQLENTNLILGEASIDFILNKFTNALFRLYLNEEIFKDKIDSLFFGKYSNFVPENFTEDQIGKAIENWLEKLSNLKEKITPLIAIENIDQRNFEISLFLEKKNDPLSIPLPFSDLVESKASNFMGEATAELKLKLIRQMFLAGEKIPELYTAMNNKTGKIVSVSLERVGQILLKSKPMLEFLGIRFLIPKELKNLLKPKITYEASSVSTVSYLNLDKIKSFKASVKINGKKLTTAELQNLKKNAGKLVPFRDGYILLDAKEIEKLISETKEKKPLNKMEVFFSILTGMFNGEELELDESFKDFIKNLRKVEDVKLPLGLNAILRPYQVNGFKWMYTNLTKGIGVCIADDMGLGKTVQVIAVLLKLKQEKKLGNQALVVCPKSLLGNWSKEIEKFAPNLSNKIYHSDKKVFLEFGDICITTYAQVRNYPDFFSKRKWSVVVLDEAQNIKNPLSEQTRAVKKIESNYKIAMSGTPVENRLTELWSIFDFTNPQFLGSLNSFKSEIAIPIERYRDHIQIEKLKTATSPLMIRRLKTDKSIISDLPDKIIKNEYPSLTVEQSILYEKVLEVMLEKIERAIGLERGILIIQLMSQLKQICNHPSQYSKKPDTNPELSGKSILLLELLEQIIERREKVLIFTQYTEMGEILLKQFQTYLEKKVDFFSGKPTKNQREKMIDSFKTDIEKNILLISLKAGGTGLNLTEATNVIHFDLWWNPAVEDQATDRAFRIGQKKNVHVYRFVTLGTFEEKIDDMMKAKKELANLTVAQGENWITEFSNDQLKDLFSLKK